MSIFQRNPERIDCLDMTIEEFEKYNKTHYGKISFANISLTYNRRPYHLLHDLRKGRGTIKLFTEENTYPEKDVHNVRAIVNDTVGGTWSTRRDPPVIVLPNLPSGDDLERWAIEYRENHFEEVGFKKITYETPRHKLPKWGRRF